MAFVGKPCDASALRRLAMSDPRVARHVPLIISFFCGGIPSHDGVGRILAAMGAEAAEVRDHQSSSVRTGSIAASWRQSS